MAQMREIKFRAWVILENKMYMNVQRAYDTLGKIDPEDIWRSFDDVVKESESGKIVLMQYTGLKDKNGKEIYEGDLVNNHDNEIRVVEYSNGAYWLVGRSKDGQVIVDMFEPFILSGEVISAESMEVIGNIYENPQLLNDKS